ncbi:lipoprotein [Qipengyuania sp. RANM35]|uniref:LPS translocon maturation chaperone LptM n=1 Tax=Qipengyuania sp. RANM35 TaxID=3068635 RepID=UPI0034DB02CC
MKKLALLALACVLAACGQKADLTPAKGASLPPAPYGTEVQPSSADLLAVDPQAAPDRSVELRTRSEERQDDPFDLPPE